MPAGHAGKPTASDQVHLLEEHIHKRQYIYPSLADPIVLTGGAQWVLGAASADLIAAAAIPAPFDIHHVIVSDPDTNEDYEIAIFGDGAEIGSIAFTRTNNFLSSIQVPIMCEIQPAGTAITAKVADGGAGGGATVGIKVSTHMY